MLGWIEIEADDGFQFFGEQRVVAHFEGFHQVRLQAVAAPDAPHRSSADAHFRRHAACGPVSLVGGLLLGGFLDDFFHGSGCDSWLAAGARSVFFQARQAALEVAVVPACGLMRGDAQLRGDLFILLARSRQECDSCTLNYAGGQ